MREAHSHALTRSREYTKAMGDGAPSHPASLQHLPDLAHMQPTKRSLTSVAMSPEVVPAAASTACVVGWELSGLTSFGEAHFVQDCSWWTSMAPASGRNLRLEHGLKMRSAVASL